VFVCFPSPPGVCVSRALYHPNNAQLGMAVMRAGVTHWHAGQTEAGHKLICKAFGILMITHGPNHPITQDLEVSAARQDGGETPRLSLVVNGPSQG